jgi:Fur family ferric uptake transcriptional regulator
VERGVATVREALGRRGLRLTAAREAVVRTALRLPGHFCARTLAARVTAAGHDGSINTIYRLLPVLVESGIVRETAIVSAHGQLFEDVFERREHEHLRCTRCHEVVEFELPHLAEAEQRLAVRHGFQLTGRAYELQGVCGDCRARAAKDAP